MAAPVDDYPMGVRFRPTDEECCRYLLGTVTGNPIAGHHLIISVADLFGEKEPWEFFSAEDECQERYFYTRLKRVAKNTKSSGSYQRFSRNIGNGTWLNNGQPVSIHGERGELLGHKRSFRYVPRKGGAHCFGEWILKEYTVPDCKLGQVKPEFKDYVLCLLRRKKDKTKKRKRKSGPGLAESDCGPAEGGLAYLLSTLVDQSGPSGCETLPVVQAGEGKKVLGGYSGNYQMMDFGYSVVPSDHGVCWVNGNYPVGLWENVVDDDDVVVLEDDDNLEELISFDMDNKDSVRSLDDWFGGLCGAMREECFTYPMW
ncbi:Unknown protein [Striga hermonthica]|uniref:NAC domain-containing protein n=1 Tax=Striga hermonthica TaxID=68872 RepID=A0A9N7NLW9_STRHE|nr:Unknown protein [Striga hermonthica]